MKKLVAEQVSQDFKTSLLDLFKIDMSAKVHSSSVNGMPVIWLQFKPKHQGMYEYFFRQEDALNKMEKVPKTHEGQFMFIATQVLQYILTDCYQFTVERVQKQRPDRGASSISVRDKLLRGLSQTLDDSIMESKAEDDTIVIKKDSELDLKRERDEEMIVLTDTAENGSKMESEEVEMSAENEAVKNILLQGLSHASDNNSEMKSEKEKDEKTNSIKNDSMLKPDPENEEDSKEKAAGSDSQTKCDTTTPLHCDNLEVVTEPGEEQHPGGSEKRNLSNSENSSTTSSNGEREKTKKRRAKKPKSAEEDDATANWEEATVFRCKAINPIWHCRKKAREKIGKLSGLEFRQLAGGIRDLDLGKNVQGLDNVTDIEKETIITEYIIKEMFKGSTLTTPEVEFKVCANS